jgi:putative membrane protein
MHYLIGNWSFDPFLIVAVILAVWHEVGLARLARKSDPERTRERRIRSLWFYGGLVVLLIAVESPIDYWSDSYFFMHMIQHLLLMFAAPVLVVAGAPWQPLLEGLPGRLGKHLTREVLAARWSKPIRAVGGFFLLPWVAIFAFNAAMIFWHVPWAYDLAYHDQTVRIWLMHGSFFVVGVLFWLQFLPSAPFRRRLSLPAQMLALLLTNVVMWVLAMTLSILTSVSWYPVYAHIPGVTLSPFADQQIGAAILWVCGDFWAIPAMVYVVRRIISEDGDISSALDRILSRRGRGYQWAGRPQRPGGDW